MNARKKAWLLGFLPAGGALNEPEVADVFDHADAFAHGFSWNQFDYTMGLWSTQPDDACVLTFRPWKKPCRET